MPSSETEHRLRPAGHLPEKQGISGNTFDSDVDLREIVQTLWRRKILIGTVLIAGLLLTALLLLILKPVYTARTLLLIDKNAPSASQELSQKGNAARFDQSIILSEIEVLQSRTLARQAVKALSLMNDPELNTRVSDAPEYSLHKGYGFKNLSVYSATLETLPPETIDTDIAEVITRFQKRLSVTPVPGSYVVKIEYKSGTPARAALVANTLADLYIEERLAEKFALSQKLKSWLDKRLIELREKVRTAEQAVEEYKATYNLTYGTKDLSANEQRSELQTRLLEARTKLAEAETRVRQVETLNNDFEIMEIAPEGVDTNMIRQLKLQAISMENDLSELANRYGEKHPKMIEKQAELESLRTAIQGELKKITRAFHDDVDFAAARVQALEDSIRTLTGQRNMDNAAMIRLRELERDADSTRLIFDRFLETYKNADKKDELANPEAKILSHAVVPHDPSFPNKTLLSLLGGIMSLTAGLGLALLLEMLDNTFRSARQIEAVTGYSCYGLIPGAPAPTSRNIADYVLEKPASTIAESIRTLRMVLNLRAKRHGKPAPKVVTITSSLPSEGKTTLSVWMGRLAARSGDKTIIVDCDLRLPNVHNKLHKPDKHPALADHLSGNASIQDVIACNDPSGVHVIYGGETPETALDMVNSGAMKTLLESLRDTYDVIILDTPACLAIPDARVLASLSDQTIYVIKWDKTPQDIVLNGIKQFSDIDYAPLNFVLTDVDVKKHARYGYGDVVYSYERYKKYYRN